MLPVGEASVALPFDDLKEEGPDEGDEETSADGQKDQIDPELNPA